MRKTSVSIITFLVYLQTFAQFPKHMVMPLGVNGISLGDTMLNTFTVLRRENIRKVIADQTTVQDRKKSYYHTEYNISNGLIRSNRFCFRRVTTTIYSYLKKPSL